MAKIRILMTGGGSGGHIYPLIAVANELKNQANTYGVKLDMRYFGPAWEYAEEIVNADMEFVPTMSVKFRRYFSLLNIVDLIKFPISLIQLLWKIFWFMPDVVFSKGGSGALAVTIISRFYLIPVVIHESDSIPGLTNKISGKSAKKIFLALATAEEYFKNKETEVVGNPVRQQLFDGLAALTATGENEKTQAKKGFGINPDEPTILVIGGSQGAEKLNNFVLENLETLLREFYVLHQVGGKNFDSYKKEYEFITKDWSEVEKNRYIYRPFFKTDMADALAAADLVICRAGSGTIFEVAAFGKPSILIPLVEAANDHQRKNAYLYAQTGAAVVIQEENMLGNLIVDEIKKILANPSQVQQMIDAARSFYRADSAAIMAKYLLTFA